MYGLPPGGFYATHYIPPAAHPPHRPGTGRGIGAGADRFTYRFFWRCEQTQAAVCADTLRLHILANSDSIQDQLLKLKVRDAVLEIMPDMLQEVSNRQQAEDAVSGSLWQLHAVAEKTLRAAGSNQTVQVRLEKAHFAAKDYGSFRLPAGEYTALRIELGKAAGHNWFCVLYPELCIGSSEARYDTPRRMLWFSAGLRSVPPCGTDSAA